MFQKIFGFCISIALALSVHTNAYASTAAIGFKMLNQTAPTAAANGYYFTYSILVESEDEPLSQLVHRVDLQASFKSTTDDELIPTGGKWSFSYSANRGLLQYLFYIPSHQPGGVYSFTGHLNVKLTGSTDPVIITLPQRQMEVGGPDDRLNSGDHSSPR